MESTVLSNRADLGAVLARGARLEIDPGPEDPAHYEMPDPRALRLAFTRMVIADASGTDPWRVARG